LIPIDFAFLLADFARLRRAFRIILFYLYFTYILHIYLYFYALHKNRGKYAKYK